MHKSLLRYIVYYCYCIASYIPVVFKNRRRTFIGESLAWFENSFVHSFLFRMLGVSISLSNLL
jgi:hypothetical protein